MTADLVAALWRTGALEKGSFRLKSGRESSIYVNLRRAVTEPALLEVLCQSLAKLLEPMPCTRLCAVPYGAWPLATALSLHRQIPTLLLRKEAKSHGTKNRIDGSYSQADRIAVIEDVVTSGGSALETAKTLASSGAKVVGVVAVVDREGGAKELLAEHGLSLASVCTLSHLKAHSDAPSTAT